MSVFNGQERFVITEALRVAAERYDEDAKAMQEAGEPYAPLKETFEKQAADCRKLLEKIEQEEDAG